MVKYVYTDALGSVVALADEAGSVPERRECEPHGAQLTPAVQDGPGNTGHVQDAGTGLVYVQQCCYLIPANAAQVMAQLRRAAR